MRSLGLNDCVRAHGLWTYEPRQGRNAATVVCSAYAVVALAPPFFSGFLFVSDGVFGMSRSLKTAPLTLLHLDG